MSRVVLGRIGPAFGIRGWVKVNSYTRPAQALLEYGTWFLGGREFELMEGRLQGNAVVAKLQGVDDRNAAVALSGRDVEVAREELPPTGPGEYYWADLVGCSVQNVSGAALGEVTSLFNNGAQDVLVVLGERERLIPFVPGPIVKSVDLEAKAIVLDWEPDY